MKAQWILLLRILLVAFLIGAAIYVAFETYFWLVSFWLLLAAGILLRGILKSVRRANEDLENFLLSISQGDFTYSVPLTSRTRFPKMADSYDTINRVFRKISTANESSHRFLKIIVEHTGVALLGFRTGSGQITLMNKAAKDLFGMPYIKNVSALSSHYKELYESLTTLSSGERKLLRMRVRGEQLQLTMLVKELVLEEHAFKLVSFQNIRPELDQVEITSWQRLIRVLTHEIKNSAIPISTLTEVISSQLTDSMGKPKELHALSPEEWEDLYNGVRTIERRSKGLVSFIKTYGELTNLPEPRPEMIAVKEFIEGITRLMDKTVRVNGTTLTTEVEDQLTIHGDPAQLEQVLINLIKNAWEAVPEKSGKIHVKAYRIDTKIKIEVIDNGTGMSEETMENIFVPFYTTKTDGTGIGLSISRQIMRAHHGDLQVISDEGKGTTLQIIF